MYIRGTYLIINVNEQNTGSPIYAVAQVQWTDNRNLIVEWFGDTDKSNTDIYTVDSKLILGEFDRSKLRLTRDGFVDLKNVKDCLLHK